MTHQGYLILIEGAERDTFSAYPPDLPGCVAGGATAEDCESEMRNAIAFHIQGLREADQPVPEPSQLVATFVDVAA